MSDSEDFNSLSQTQIEEIQEKYRARFNSKTNVSNNDQKKKVLFLGASRSGKTTLRDVITDLCVQPKELNLFSATRAPSTVVKTIDGVEMTLIDGPGLFDKISADQKEVERLTNDQIIKMIIEHVGDFTQVDCVFFCISASAGISVQQIQAIEILGSLLKGKAKKIGLCITRTDRQNSRWQAVVLDQIRQHPKMGPLIDEYSMDIFFSGCVEPTMAFNQDLLARKYKRLQGLRRKILDWIIDFGG